MPFLQFSTKLRICILIFHLKIHFISLGRPSFRSENGNESCTLIFLFKIKDEDYEFQVDILIFVDIFGKFSLQNIHIFLRAF